MGKRKTSAVTITIIVGLSITFVVLFYPTVVLWVKYPSVQITGTIDYTGLPEPEGIPIHGFNYLFVPDQGEIRDLFGNPFPDLITLQGSEFDPDLDGKRVRSGVIL